MKKTFTQALSVVKQYNLCMHGKLIAKPTLKEFRESLSIVLDNIQEERLTQSDLVRFGNYLLSEKRKKLFKSHPCPNGTLKERLSMVHDCDIANFKDRK